MDNKQLFVFILMLTLVNGSPRIIGGIEVSDRKMFAYQISLRYDDAHICGGSIINEKYILTASHCVFYSDGSLMDVKRLKIVSGNLNINEADENTKISNVKSIFSHSDYNKRTTENDIAIIELKDKLITNDYVKPVRLNEEINVSSESCIVSGWGFTQEGAEKSNVLRFVIVPIVTKDDCNVSYKGIIKVGMICAGHNAGGRDACQYDSGGPMLCDDKLTGIVSWGMGCGRAGFPGVYTNVAYYNDFIESVLNPTRRKRTKINGQEVNDYNHFPYQVSIRLNKQEHICDGSIIDEMYVLTSASCLYINGNMIQAEELSVAVGVPYMQEERRQVRNVKSVIIHENFNKIKTDNDIAILKISEPFKFDSSVNKIKLANESAKSTVICTVSGWIPNIWNDPRTTHLLRYSHLRVGDNAKCKKTKNDVNSLFCANGLKDDDSCHGNRGSPLVCNNQLVGIQSFDDGCKEEGLPGAYTDVPQYSTWIENRIRSSSITSDGHTYQINLYLLLIVSFSLL